MLLLGLLLPHRCVAHWRRICVGGFLLLFPFDFGRMEEVTMNPMRLLFPLLLAVVGGETERNV